MSQKGIHTWDLILQYHSCPFCGNIIESREDYQYIFGKYKKDVKCDRCHRTFTVTKNVKPTFGPLIGDPEPVEIDWKERKNGK